MGSYSAEDYIREMYEASRKNRTSGGTGTYAQRVNNAALSSASSSAKSFSEAASGAFSEWHNELEKQREDNFNKAVEDYKKAVAAKKTVRADQQRGYNRTQQLKNGQSQSAADTYAKAYAKKAQTDENAKAKQRERARLLYEYNQRGITVDDVIGNSSGTQPSAIQQAQERGRSRTIAEYQKRLDAYNEQYAEAERQNKNAGARERAAQSVISSQNASEEDKQKAREYLRQATNDRLSSSDTMRKSSEGAANAYSRIVDTQASQAANEDGFRAKQEVLRQYLRDNAGGEATARLNAISEQFDQWDEERDAYITELVNGKHFGNVSTEEAVKMAGEKFLETEMSDTQRAYYSDRESYRSIVNNLKQQDATMSSVEWQISQMTDEQVKGKYQNLQFAEQLYSRADELNREADRYLNAGDMENYGAVQEQIAVLRERASSLEEPYSDMSTAERHAYKMRFLEIQLKDEVKELSNKDDYVAIGEKDTWRPTPTSFSDRTTTAVNPGDKEGNMADVYLGYMEESEREVYYALVGQKNYEAAQTYYEAIEYRLKQRHMEKVTGTFMDAAEENPAGMVVINALMNATVNPAMGIVNIGENISSGGTTGMSSAALASQLNSSVTQGVALNMEGHGLTENQAEFLSGVITSIANNLTQTAFLRFAPTGTMSEFAQKIAGFVPLAMMGTNAAAETLNTQLQNGASLEDALLYSSIVGGMEIVTEKIGLDEFMRATGGGVEKTIIGKFISKTGRVDFGAVNKFVKAGLGILNQSLSEAGEESISEIVDGIADIIINGERSVFYQNYVAYMAKGYSEDEARSMACKDFAKQVGNSALAGLVSGGVFGAAGGAGIVMNYNSIGNSILNTDGMGGYYSEGSRTTLAYQLIEDGMQFRDGSNTKTFAEQLYTNVVEKGHQLTAGDISSLYYMMESDMQHSSDDLVKATETEQGKAALSSLATEVFRTGTVSATDAIRINNVMADIAKGKDITDAQIRNLKLDIPAVAKIIGTRLGYDYLAVDHSTESVKAAIGKFREGADASERQTEAFEDAKDIMHVEAIRARGTEAQNTEAEVAAVLADAEGMANSQLDAEDSASMAQAESLAASDLIGAVTAEQEAESDSGISYGGFSEAVRAANESASAEEIRSKYEEASRVLAESGTAMVSAGNGKYIILQMNGDGEVDMATLDREQLREELKTAAGREITEAELSEIIGALEQDGGTVMSLSEMEEKASGETGDEDMGEKPVYSKENPNVVAELIAGELAPKLRTFGIKEIVVDYDGEYVSGNENGKYDEDTGTIYLNGQVREGRKLSFYDGVPKWNYMNAAENITFILGHEITHPAQGLNFNTKESRDRTNQIIQMYQAHTGMSDAQVNERVRQLQEQYQKHENRVAEQAGKSPRKIRDRYARQEFASDAMGLMLMETNGLRSLSGSDKSGLGRKILNLAKNLRASISGIRLAKGNGSRADALRVTRKAADDLVKMLEKDLGETQEGRTAGRKNDNSQQETGKSRWSITSIDTNPDTHTEKEMALILEYVSYTDNKTADFFEGYINGKVSKFGRHTISKVTEKQASDLRSLLGRDFSGYSNAINSNAVNHIWKRHGVNGLADQSMKEVSDAARVGYILENYDTVTLVYDDNGKQMFSKEFLDQGGYAPLVRYSKKINGTYYVVEAVPEGKWKKLWVVSEYMQKNNSTVTQASNAQTYSGNNAQGEPASPVSVDSNIADADSDVNRKVNENSGNQPPETGVQTNVLTSETTQGTVSIGRHSISDSESSTMSLEQRVSGDDLLNEQDAANRVGIDIDTETESAAPSDMFSLDTWNESEYVTMRDQAASNLAKKLDITEDQAKKYIDDMNSIAKVIADDRTRLDFNAIENASAFVKNAEYGGSFDFSTVCKKRRLFTGTFSAIQNALPNTVLTAEEVLRIRSMMKERGEEVSCGLCYVEGSRTRLSEYAGAFVEAYAKKYPDAEYVPTIAELATPEGQEMIRTQHPELYKTFTKWMNKGGRFPGETSSIFAIQARPKPYQLATAYNGEVLKNFRDNKQNAGKVKAKNLNGGLRLQSFSDFEIIHLLDTMQVVMDMAQVGLAGQAYTKVPDFAWALGNTGMKINLSLIAKDVDENGRLVLDDVEGMPEAEAMKLRNEFSDNVGTILVVFNDDQLKAAMKDERIDFIIPFHRSQWRSSQYRAMGLPAVVHDYTNTQNEKYIEPVYTKSGKKKKPGNLMPNSYWDFTKTGKENAEKYLELCAQTNRKPKFSELLVDNGDGSYSLQPDGSTDGYWKTLIDFKMYNNDGVGVPQMPVKPDFRMDQCMRMLNEYTGGHNSFPVSQEVVDAFLAEYEKEHGGEEYEGVRFSINENFSDEIDAWLESDRSATETLINVGRTSDALTSIGVADRGIVWSGKKIDKVMKKHPQMTKEVIKQVPYILENPIIIQKSSTVDSRIVVFGDVVDSVGTPVVAALELSPRSKGGDVLDFNIISSAYGKDNDLRGFIKRGETLFLDMDSNRARDFLESLQLQLRSAPSISSSIGSIAYDNGTVNIHGVSGEELFDDYYPESRLSISESDDTGYMDAIMQATEQEEAQRQEMKRQASSTARQAKAKQREADKAAKAGNRAAAAVAAQEAAALRQEAEAQRIESMTYDEMVDEAMADAGIKPMTPGDLVEQAEKNARARTTKRYDQMTPAEKRDELIRSIMRKNGALSGGKTVKVSRVATNTFAKGAFFEGLRTTAGEDLQKVIENLDGYNPVSEQESITEAAHRLDTDYMKWFRELPKKEMWTGRDADTAMLILHNLQKESAPVGDYAEMIRWQKIIQEHTTEAARFVQALAKWSRTATGIMQKQLDLIEEMAETQKLSDEKKQWLIRQTIDYANLIDRVQDGDKEGLVDVIMRINQDRNFRNSTPNSKLTKKWFMEQDFEFLDTYALNALANLSGDFKKRTVWEKASTVQFIMQLGNPRTWIKNIASNTTFMPMESIAENAFGRFMDMLLKKKSGNRSVAGTWGHGGTVKGAIEGGKRAFLEVRFDVDAGKSRSKYERADVRSTSRRTFKLAQNWLLRRVSQLEMINGIALTVTDEMYKGATYRVMVDSYANLVARGLATQEQVDQIIQREMKYRTFQDDTFIGTILKGAHDLLNTGRERDADGNRVYRDADGMITTADKGGRNERRFGGRTWGLGDVVVKYRVVPGAIVVRTIEFSPIGFLNGVCKTAEFLKNGGSIIDQRDAAMAVARGMTGSLVAGVMYILAKSGIFKRKENEEDKDVAAMEGAQGFTGTQINISALNRLRNGEDNWNEWREGDSLEDLGFLEPVGALINMGNLTWKIASGEGLNVVDALLANVEIGANAFTDLNMMDTLNDIFYAVMYRDEDETVADLFANVAITLGTSAITGFMPSVLRQAAQASDNYYRDTNATGGFVNQLLGDGEFANGLQGVANRVMLNVPGLRQMLPTKLDPFGNEKTYGDGVSAGSVLNTFLNPGRYNRLSETELQRELKAVYDESGDASFYPDRKAPNSLSFGKDAAGNDVKITMTYDQKREYLQTAGDTYKEILAETMNDQRYLAASSSEKAEMLKEIKEYSEYRAKLAFNEKNGSNPDWEDAKWRKTEMGMDAGFGFTEMRGILSDVGAFESEKDAYGDSKLGSIDDQVLDYLNDKGYSDDEKLSLYSIINGGVEAGAVRRLSILMSDSEFTYDYHGESITAHGAGLTFSDAVSVIQEYHKLRAEGSQTALNEQTEMNRWLRANGYSDQQIDVIGENYKLYGMIPQQENSVMRKLLDSGVDDDSAYNIAGEIADLDPVDGSEDVEAWQKYDAVLNGHYTDAEVKAAFSAIAGKNNMFSDLDDRTAKKLIEAYRYSSSEPSKRDGSIISMTVSKGVTKFDAGFGKTDYTYTDEQKQVYRETYINAFKAFAESMDVTATYTNMDGDTSMLLNKMKDICSGYATAAALRKCGVSLTFSNVTSNKNDGLKDYWKVSTAQQSYGISPATYVTIWGEAQSIKYAYTDGETDAIRSMLKSYVGGGNAYNWMCYSLGIATNNQKRALGIPTK